MKKEKCCLCNKSSDLYEEFDECFPMCRKCFNMLLRAGLLKEGPDDMWHFINDEVRKLLC